MTLSNKSKSLCVIVLNFHGADDTRRCVQSLLGQSLDTLYLVDNSVDPKQADEIKNIASELQASAVDFKIKTVINSQNLGFSCAINDVLLNDVKCGGHALYLTLNNDVVLSSNTLESLLSAKYKKPEVNLVSAKIVSNGKNHSRMYYSKLFGYTSYEQKSSSMFPFLSGACLLIDGTLLSERGIFDEDFFMYGEDVLLSWNIQQLGQELRCADDGEVFHAGSASSEKGSLFYEYHVARGHIVLARKLSHSRFEWFSLIMGRGCYLSIRALIRSYRFKSLTPFKGFLKAWFHIPVKP